MRSFVGIIGRSKFFLFSCPRIKVFPVKSFVISVPAGSPWISSLVRGVNAFSFDCKPIATHAPVDEAGVAEANLNMILAAIQKAPRSSEEICTRFLGNLCSDGNLSVAATVLKSLRNRSIFIHPNVYNLVMEAAFAANQFEIVSSVFKDLIMSCKSLPSSSYIALVKGFMNIDDHVLLVRLLKEVSELTFPGSTIVINKIIFAFGECRQFDKALLIFDQMMDLKCKPDLITYNMVLDILGRAGRVDEMLHEFSSMKDAGITPDFVSYNTLLNQLQKAGRLDLCLMYIKEMRESSIEPDLLTYTALISSFGKSGNIRESLELFDDMKKKHIRPSIYIYRSLINSAKKMGRVELALSLLEEMNASLSDLAGPNDFKRKRRTVA